jgi:hypothetical protein
VKKSSLLLVVVLLCAACSSWDWKRTDVKPVTARVAGKVVRHNGRMPADFVIILEYEGKRGEVVDDFLSPARYHAANTGDQFYACLITYLAPDKTTTRTDLRACPDE